MSLPQDAPDTLTNRPLEELEPRDAERIRKIRRRYENREARLAEAVRPKPSPTPARMTPHD